MAYLNQHKASSYLLSLKANPDEALAIAVEALEQAGWKSVLEVYHGARGGFRARSKPISKSLCHRYQPGSMGVMAREGSRGTLLSLITYRQEQPMSCDEQMSRNSMRHRGPELQKYLPVLDIPTDAKSSNIRSGVGGDEYSARVVVSTSMSRAELMSYFDGKIRDQDWMPDVGWSGSTSSGTVWTRTDEDGKALAGILRVADEAADVFNVRFTVLSVDPG